MRRTLIAAAAACAATSPAPASADEPADPRALFGFTEPEPDPEAAPCDGEPAWPCVASGDAPAAIGERLTRGRLTDLGAADTPLALAAARALGGWIEADGQVAFPGASAIETRWTVDGFAIDDVAAGGRGLGVPLPFLDTIDVVTAGMPARVAASTGAVVDGRLRRAGDRHEVDAGAWLRLGAPARERPAIPDTYDPLVLTFEPVRGASAAAVASGPLHRGAGAWYVVGLAPAGFHDRATRAARRLRDADGDGRYDRHPDRAVVLDTIDTRAIEDTSWSAATMARLGARVGAGELVGTLLGNHTGRTAVSPEGTPSATALDLRGDALAAFATWTARWGATGVRVQAGWYRDARRQRAADPAAADAVQIGTAYIPSPADVPEDAAFAAACVDGDAGDPFPTVFNCPLPSGYYLRGGAGWLIDTTVDRPTATAEVTHRIGRHRLAAGVWGEDARLVRAQRFTGGTLERRLDEEVIISLELVELGDGPGFDVPCLGDRSCRILDVDRQTFRTRHLAAWIEDVWEPAPGLVVAAGLRWASAEVGSDVAFRGQLEPRLGVALDPTRQGRARLHASWGRYHAILPADLGRPLYQTSEVLATIQFPGAATQELGDRGALDVAAELAPPTIDELAVGAEWVMADAVHLGATVTRRRLWRGLEDAGDLLVTPGLAEGVGLAPLRRDSTDVQVWLANAPDAAVQVRAGWLHTRQRGTWAGPHDPLEGATLYRSSWDGSTGNAYGRLPFDLPHRFLAELVTGGRAAGFDLTVGARFELASGRPVGVTAGDGTIPLLPVGSAGRMPLTTSSIVHVAARRGAWTIGVDLIDALNRRAPVAVDERWTTAEVRPIEGGDATDLLWVVDEDTGAPARKHPGHGVATRYQPPLLARVFVTARF